MVVDATGEVFGEAPNIAARIQGTAEPGAILVTATVQRQTAGLFVAEDLGAHELKGVSELMTLYRIVRASGGGRRGGTRALTPLVGREISLGVGLVIRRLLLLMARSRYNTPPRRANMRLPGCSNTPITSPAGSASV